MTNPNITIHLCNYSNANDLEAVSRLMNAYIEDDMGGGETLSPLQTLHLINALNEHPKSIVLLAKSEHTSYCGMLIAFENISTFTVSPMINIHDVIVLKDHRNQGIGKILMKTITAIAQERNCSRITLEVREDNYAAQHLYKSMGFNETSPTMYYWRKNLRY